jgi:uncharacterized protein (DUF1015 family)
VVDRAEAARIAAGNPVSFLHVGRSDIDLPPETDPHDPKVYQTARENLRSFMVDGTLIREKAPTLYLYQLTMNGRSQLGIVGCVHIDDYERDVIKKHERTRKDKEDDRTKHVLVLRAHAEPVFLTFKTQHYIEQLNATEMAEAPIYDFVSPIDGVRQQVWRIARTQAYVDAFRRIPEAYVADGHHRCASAWRAGTELRAAAKQPSPDDEYNWFLAVLFPSSQLTILPYNRVVKDLNGMTPAAFLDRLRSVGSVSTTTEPMPDRPGSFGIYLDRTWYRLEIDPETIPADDPIKSLDAEILSTRVLEPILGIGDIRSDQRIDFVGGARGPAELARRVDSGAAAVAFSLFPVRIEQVIAVADQGQVMPPKSTWFEPKLKSGLFVHTLD